MELIKEDKCPQCGRKLEVKFFHKVHNDSNFPALGFIIDVSCKCGLGGSSALGYEYIRLYKD